MSRIKISILGCGWLGFPLASSWIVKGFQVLGSTTSIEKVVQLESVGIEPFVMDLSRSSFDETKAFWDSSILVVMVPPRSKNQAPGVYRTQMQQLIHQLGQLESLKHILYTSSTSVYSNVSGLVKEEDVQDLSQELVEVEQLFLSLTHKKVSILRLGGLTGGARMLAKHFAGKTGIAGGNQPVNLVHQEDALGAIQFVVQEGLTGVFNVCAPLHPLKKDFYTQLCQRFNLPVPEFKEEVHFGKTVDPSKIQGAGYSFLYPDPFLFTYEV